MNKKLALPFAVFDKFGGHADHRVQDYGRACADAAIERCAALFDMPPGIHGESEDWSREAAADIRALKVRA